jgi:hypothetical protein
MFTSIVGVMLIPHLRRFVACASANDEPRGIHCCHSKKEVIDPSLCLVFEQCSNDSRDSLNAFVHIVVSAPLTWAHIS